MRLAYLNNYRLDLEYKMTLVSTAKLELSTSINDLLNVGTDLEPDSPEVKALEKRRERLYLVEKKLDEQMNRYQTQLKMVEAEMQQCQQSVDKNIQYTYGGR
ncbi:hypothetical protein tpqmel_0658 [Candidatus Gastranaerophilus sp. (ex Termes propinquus)]|nr:hypothetical protein tpqmel_0658 [Candidatus Gastranaerophilus sp. (ex Termes propinquus)]